MPRIARVVGTGYPHHITQRGNYRQDIFENDIDREMYLDLVRKESEKYGLKIISYCLMTNHVHFIAVPEFNGSMGDVFKYVNMKYAQYFNKKKGERGHLFQGRFFSSIMDENYTTACARYIERNPVRAGMVKMPCDWKWSSAEAHCGYDKADILKVKELFGYIEMDMVSWRRYVEQLDDPEEVKRIKDCTGKGRPLAGPDFVKKIEQKIKRVLTVRPKGRPRNPKSAGANIK